MRLRFVPFPNVTAPSLELPCPMQQSMAHAKCCSPASWASGQHKWVNAQKWYTNWEYNINKENDETIVFWIWDFLVLR